MTTSKPHGCRGQGTEFGDSSEKGCADAKEVEQKREAEEHFKRARAVSEDAARRARSVAVDVEEAARAVSDAERTVKQATKEIAERIEFMAVVQKGLDQLDRGEGIPHEEVKLQLASWLTS